MLGKGLDLGREGFGAELAALARRRRPAGHCCVAERRYSARPAFPDPARGAGRLRPRATSPSERSRAAALRYCRTASSGLLAAFGLTSAGPFAAGRKDYPNLHATLNAPMSAFGWALLPTLFCGCGFACTF